MPELTFVCVLAALFTALLTWAFRRLPAEEWQMLAAVPVARHPAGGWRGVNFTWYGVFLANACVFASAMLLVLLSAIAVPTAAILVLVAVVLIVCLPSARWVARLVEGQRHTFTIAGSFFVGVLVLPLAAWGLNATLGNLWSFHLPLVPVLAAVAVCYALGEGLGRLACISFGCCYGKPLCQCHPLVRRLLGERGFTFTGRTKKAAYEGGLEGARLAPTQALTAVLFSAAGLLASLLFLRGWMATALIVSIVVTQGWRFASEFLRADYRGGGRISAYQIMAAFAVVYVSALGLMAGNEATPAADIQAGLRALWNPLVLVSLQGLWLAVFLYTGRSTVTRSTITFDMAADRVSRAA